MVFIFVPAPQMPARLAAGLLGVGVAAAGYLSLFDAVWSRSERATLALRAVQRRIPDTQPIPQVARPEPAVGVLQTFDKLSRVPSDAVELLRASIR